MAQIKQFHNTNSNQNDYDDQIKKHKQKKTMAILIPLLIAVLIVILIKTNSDAKVYSAYSVKSTVDWSVSSDSKMIEYNGDILVYSIDGAYCSDTKGKSKWNITYQMQNPLVNINGDYVALADYNGNTIYVLNKDGKQGEITTDLPIKKFGVSENGYVTVIVANSSTTSIYFYSSDGEKIAYFKTTMEISGYPFDVSISDNGKLVAVDYMYVDSSAGSNQFVSRIAFYNFGSVGQNYEDHYVSGYDYADSVVGILQFMNDETAFAISDTNLYIYKGKQIPELSKSIELPNDVKSVYYDENYIGIVCQGSTETKAYVMDVYNNNGEHTGTIQFDLEYSDIAFHNKSVMIYNANEVSVYTMSGKCKFNSQLESSITLLLGTSSSTEYVFASKNKIDTVKLK